MKTFVICTRPIFTPLPDGDMIAVSPERWHRIRGKDIRYAFKANESWFEIVDAQGIAAFSCPTYMVIWCRESQAKTVKSNIVHLVAVKRDEPKPISEVPHGS